MKKRIIATLLVLLLISGLASCGKTATTSNESCVSGSERVTYVENGVTIDKTALPEDTVLKVDAISESSDKISAAKAAAPNATAITAYEITATHNNAQLQISSMIEVSFPVYTEYDRAKQDITVYHLSDSGTLTAVSATIEVDIIKINISSFGIYVIIITAKDDTITGQIASANTSSAVATTSSAPANSASKPYATTSSAPANSTSTPHTTASKPTGVPGESSEPASVSSYTSTPITPAANFTDEEVKSFAWRIVHANNFSFSSKREHSADWQFRYDNWDCGVLSADWTSLDTESVFHFLHDYLYNTTAKIQAEPYTEDFQRYRLADVEKAALTVFGYNYDFTKIGPQEDGYESLYIDETGQYIVESVYLHAIGGERGCDYAYASHKILDADTVVVTLNYEIFDSFIMEVVSIDHSAELTIKKLDSGIWKLISFQKK